MPRPLLTDGECTECTAALLSLTASALRALLQVIVGSEAMKAPQRPKGEGADSDRSADGIVKTGLYNLKEEPAGWFFGEPSALYSNQPAPRYDGRERLQPGVS
jgi:hypothetical protein